MRRGICYDIGTTYNDASAIRQDLKSYYMKELDLLREIGFNSIHIYGNDFDMLLRVSESAVKKGFYTVLDPRFLNMGLEQYFGNLKKLSKEVSKIFQNSDKLIFSLGNEITIETKIFLHHDDYEVRTKKALFMTKDRNSKSKMCLDSNLNKLLIEAKSVVEEKYSGEISYISASWESVDWSRFKTICINKYFSKKNMNSYFDDLKSLKKKYGKEINITEFGVPTFKGSEKYGGVAWLIARNKKCEYSQEYQAKILTNQIKKLKKNKEYIDGFFIYTFIEPKNGLINPNNLLENYGIVEYYLDDEFFPKESFKAIKHLFKSQDI